MLRELRCTVPTAACLVERASEFLPSPATTQKGFGLLSTHPFQEGVGPYQSSTGKAHNTGRLLRKHRLGKAHSFKRTLL